MILFHTIICVCIEDASAIAEAVIAKQDERDKTKRNSTVIISSATQSKVDNLFRSVGFHKEIYDGSIIDTPSAHFDPFNWAHRAEDDGVSDARVHIERELAKFGVRIGRGGYVVEDVHSNKSLLSFRDEKIGEISGGTDIVIVPFKTAKSGIKECICVLFEVKTEDNVRGFSNGLKHFEPQAQVELLASRCLSDQPHVLLVLTDLVSGAILYTIDYSLQYKSFSLVEREATLDVMGSVVENFLREKTVPDVNFRPIEADSNPRDISCIEFKKRKLSNDLGLALEHFNDMVADAEPNSKERVCLVEQLFRSIPDLDRMPSVVQYGMYS
jgi:hypothetical protein